MQQPAAPGLRTRTIFFPVLLSTFFSILFSFTCVRREGHENTTNSSRTSCDYCVHSYTDRPLFNPGAPVSIPWASRAASRCVEGGRRGLVGADQTAWRFDAGIPSRSVDVGLEQFLRCFDALWNGILRLREWGWAGCGFGVPCFFCSFLSSCCHIQSLTVAVDWSSMIRSELIFA